MGKLLCLAKCVASKLMCCLEVNGVCVVGLVGVSCVGSGLFFVL